MLGDEPHDACAPCDCRAAAQEDDVADGGEAMDTRKLKSWNSAPRNAEEERLDLVLRQAASLAPPHMPNTVIVLLTNSGFHEMLLNFLHHANRVSPPVKNYVVFPLDPGELKNVTRLKNVRYYWPETGLDFSPRARNFRSLPYNQIVVEKFRIAEKVLSLGFNPFVVDVDNVFLRNPFNFFHDFPLCDFMAVSDSIEDKILDEDDEQRWESRGKRMYINTGFILWQNKPNVLHIVRQVINEARKDPGSDDQRIFALLLNELYERNVGSAVQEPNILNVPVMERHKRCANIGGLKASILPPGLFGSQKIVLQTFKLARRQMTPPYVIHFGHLSGFYEKRSFMQQWHLWNLTLP